MQTPIQTIKPEYILEVILRRRWFIIAPLCITLIIGIYMALTLPKIYEASTLILVQQQRVPSNYVQSVVTTDLTSRLRTISQQILSRTNIERIINDYKLFSGPDQAKMFMEQKVENIRGRISVDVAKRASTFSISFKGPEPEKVKNIANSLATYFIDENLKIRESQALGTSDFLDDELEMMLQRLQDSENTLREYRQKYRGELPDQLGSNLSILNQLHEELSNKQNLLQDSKMSLSELEKQRSENQKAAKESYLLDDSSLFDFESEGSAELAALRDRLAALKTRYKDQHPDVVRIRKMIENLEAEEAAATENNDESIENDLEGIYGDELQFDYKTLQQAQLNELRIQIKELETDIEEIERKIETYRERVENTPKREEEMLAIQRNYDNYNKAYNSLLNRRLEAEISVNMEKKQKGEQFQIIDPAKTPEMPIAPNLKMLFYSSVLMGLAIGGGIVFLFEFLIAPFRGREDIEQSLGLPILATTPLILHPEVRRKQRLNLAFSIASILFSAALIVLLYVVTVKDVQNPIQSFINII